MKRIIKVVKNDNAQKNVKRLIGWLSVLATAEKQAAPDSSEARKSLRMAEHEARKAVEYANAEKDIPNAYSLIEKKLKNMLFFWRGAVTFEPALKKLDNKAKAAYKELADSIRDTLEEKGVADAVSVQLGTNAIQKQFCKLLDSMEQAKGALTVAIRNIENQGQVPGTEREIIKMHDQLTTTRSSVMKTIQALSRYTAR